MGVIEPGAHLGDGRYRVVRLLGEGGQAATYEAVDAREGRLVAVKRFVVRGAKSWKDVELAEREANVLRSIDHPLVPRYIENFEEDGALYLVTELVEGKSLAALLREGRRFGASDVVRLLTDLADATRYLHGRAPPVIHRDIKPGNVLLRKDGRFCLVDFGAVRAKLAKSGGSTVVGTFGYMPPEQFQGRAMPQSDVYAVAATALTILTGREPEDQPHQGLRIDVAAALGPTADAALVRALTILLEPNPDLRPVSLHQVLATLPSYDSSSGGPSGGATGGRRPGGSPPKHPPGGGGGPTPPSRPHRVRPHPHELGPPPAVAVVLLGIARIAVYFAVVLFVPLLLATMSIVFGRPLRRAAGQVRDAGRRAMRRIDRARAEALESSPGGVAGGRAGGPAETPAPGARVDMTPNVGRRTPSPADLDREREAEWESEREARAEEEADGDEYVRRILDESSWRSGSRRSHGKPGSKSSKGR